MNRDRAPSDPPEGLDAEQQVIWWQAQYEAAKADVSIDEGNAFATAIVSSLRVRTRRSDWNLWRAGVAFGRAVPTQGDSPPPTDVTEALGPKA